MTHTIALWPDGPQGVDLHPSGEDVLHDNGDVIVRNVTHPSLETVLPEPGTANGTAMIVAPGGGFHFLSWENEGTRIAEQLAARGVTAFVLRYRLSDTGPTRETYAVAMQALMQRLLTEALEQGGVDLDGLVPEVRRYAYQDGQDAVRLVRSRARDFGVQTDKIGFLGFSGGAFVATAAALSDDESARPDFVAAIYGGSAETPVPPNAPPLFALVTADDHLCRRTCIDTALAWVAAGRPAELHVYERGGHGFGARTLDLPVDGWMDRLTDWLSSGGFL